MRQRCPRPECQDEIPPMGGPLSPSASEEIPPRVVRSDRPACDALAAPSQDATATARPVMPPQGDALPLQDVVSKHEVCLTVISPDLHTDRPDGFPRREGSVYFV